MPHYVTSKDLFVIPDGDRYILYLPLKGIITSVNQAAVHWLVMFQREPGKAMNEQGEIFQRFASIGILEDDHVQVQKIWKGPPPFHPTDVVILATTECNFRCKYCYASAGTLHRKFNPDAARAAIRLIVSNAIDIGERTCGISFHGGGEPTMEFEFLRMCVEYARQLAGSRLEVQVGITSNGYLSENQMQWMGKELYSAQISCDGPAWIQNDQRPLANGKPSFDPVYRTIQYLQTRIPELLIKSTITAHHVHDMPEIARFFCESFSIPRFHFGPVLEEGYSLQTGYGAADPMEFVKYALEAQEVARSYQRQVVVSLAQKTFPNYRTQFCGLPDPNFTISVDGSVSACYEVLYADDPRAEVFHYGKYDPQMDDFVFDREKIEILQRRQVMNLPHCQKCFAKWQCAGDCQIRNISKETGEEALPKQDFRCIVNRELVRRKLIETLQGQEVTRIHPIQDHSFGLGK